MDVTSPSIRRNNPKVSMADLPGIRGSRPSQTRSRPSVSVDCLEPLKENSIPASPLEMDAVRIDAVVALRIAASLAFRREFLPFAIWQKRVFVACTNLSDVTGLAAVQRSFTEKLVPVQAERDSLRRAIHRVYSGSKSGPNETRIGRALSRVGQPNGASRASSDRQSTNAQESIDIAELSEELLTAAQLREASDIHLDPDADGLRIRFRVDGALEDVHRLPRELVQPLLNRFKVMAEMDIAERRAPQDGGFRRPIPSIGRSIDIRAATLPTQWGERMTLRLLGLQTGTLTLTRLGMSAHQLSCFETALGQPEGMILLTGPTGSGKSTTLYAGVRHLLDREVLHVITIEDPIEYFIAGVAQVAVDSADKTSFTKALRSALRHDPDVVMIGEVRDGETAGTAVKASLTGHLVLSTLHTSSAAGTVTRLADMGVERYLIASTLRLSVAQRLVRRLCPRCRRARRLTGREATGLGHPEAEGITIYEPGGCLYCGGRGFLGRLALFELLPIDEEAGDVITHGGSEEEINRAMKRQGMPFLRDDALTKLIQGDACWGDVQAVVALHF